MTDIYLIRSATAPFIEKGQTGEIYRSLEQKGHEEKVELGQHILEIVGGEIAEVRFAPAIRTRQTALGVLALVYSSHALQRDDDLTQTDPEQLRAYLESLNSSPTLLFTHLDVIQSAVKAINGIHPADHDIPTASLTKIVTSDEGLNTEYVGKTYSMWRKTQELTTK